MSKAAMPKMTDRRRKSADSSPELTALALDGRWVRAGPQPGIVSGFGIDTICPAVGLHQRDMRRLATIDGARVWHLED